jgi:hypothetical protein
MKLRHLLLIASFIIAGPLAPEALAKKPKMQRGFNDRLVRPGEDDPKKRRSPEEQKKINDARDAVKAAEERLAAVRDKLEAEFRKSDAWVKASEDLKTAQAEYDAARTPVLEKVRSSPQYVAAVERKQTAQALKDKLATDSSADPKKKAEAQQEFLAASSEITRMETSALDADETVKQTKARFFECQATCKKLQDEFEASVTANPEWKSARTHLDRCKDRLINLLKA